MKLIFSFIALCGGFSEMTKVSGFPAGSNRSQVGPPGDSIHSNLARKVKNKYVRNTPAGVGKGLRRIPAFLAGQESFLGERHRSEILPL